MDAAMGKLFAVAIGDLGLGYPLPISAG